MTAKEVKKFWGKEQVYTNNHRYCMKVLELEPGKMCSIHYHKKKDETFLVIEGRVLLEAGAGLKARYILDPGDAYRLSPFTKHRFRAWGGPAKMVECSTHHSDDDVVRLEESGPANQIL